MILLLRKPWKRTGPSGLRGTRSCRTPARLSTSRLTTFSTLPSWIGYFYMFDCKTNPGQINHLNQIRDCGSDFPWDLDVSAMFKVGIFSITITVDITLAITRSGTITEKRISSHTETRASLQSLQVQKNVISCSSVSRDLCWLPDLLIHSTSSTKLSCLISISITSFFPGTQSPIHHTNFMYALDDSLDTFMHQTKKWKLKTTMTMTITTTKVNGMEE